ncbi:MAG: MerR family transcriptional regulator [Oligoflexia bacterium]|nr:MerR family transcriptional regulator [Oligoflexia bacterium]
MTTKTTTPTNKIQIPDRLFFRIGDVAQILGVKPHVLRYWEGEFSIVAPGKSGSGQRVYRRSDVETLLMVKRLLHDERYSIEGARRRIRELRKEGELSSFKKEIATEPEAAPQPGVSSAVREALQRLATRPIGELFRY